MRKFDLSLRSSRSSYFATFRHQLTILSKTDALDEEKWLNMLGTFVKDWFRYESQDRKSGSAGMPRSEERFSRNAETDLVCRLLLEKKTNGDRVLAGLERRDSLPGRAPQGDRVAGTDSRDEPLRLGRRRARRGGRRAGDAADAEGAVHDAGVRVALEVIDAIGERHRPRHGDGDLDVGGLVDARADGV